ncbi:MAG: divergent polysaccharide deacetylase family protein [Paracoccaceae bacterium]|nr:divergent polysaccharide deacetylase family protein [Paracoccaceae bacterium]MDG2259339.1 divergent polysaccharide deacetylase family protein [Paracoccaceae bacterium]
MARGLLFGIICGGLFTALFLAAVSLLAPMPDPNAEIMAPEPQVTVAPTMPVEDPTPTPQMASPTIEDAPALAETTSAIVPTTGDAESNLAEVSDENESLPEVSEDNQPMVDTSTTVAPAAPEAETNLSIATESTEPVQNAVATTAISEVLIEESKTLSPDAPLAEDTTVVTNRLPTISGETSSDDALQEPMTEPEAIDDRPLMAIILIDTGEYNIGPEALASFPYPISFAIDPLRDDALEAAERYRSKGFELLVTADLPESGDASLAEIALAPTIESIPGAVGFLEGTNGGLQGNMELAEAVLKMVEDTGNGLVLRSKGLNAAQQQADGRDLPVATLFRDFDASGQNASVIRRFLDQAAFKARQEGSVVMVGRLRPATISALLLWGLQDRATSVALTPVSTIWQQ